MPEINFEWNETEYSVKHKTHYKREVEAYEQAEREDMKHEYIIRNYRRIS